MSRSKLSCHPHPSSDKESAGAVQQHRLRKLRAAAQGSETSGPPESLPAASSPCDSPRQPRSSRPSSDPAETEPQAPAPQSTQPHRSPDSRTDTHPAVCSIPHALGHPASPRHIYLQGRAPKDSSNPRSRLSHAAAPPAASNRQFSSSGCRCHSLSRLRSSSASWEVFDEEITKIRLYPAPEDRSRKPCSACWGPHFCPKLAQVGIHHSFQSTAEPRALS